MTQSRYTINHHTQHGERVEAARVNGTVWASLGNTTIFVTAESAPTVHLFALALIAAADSATVPGVADKTVVHLFRGAAL